MSANNFLSYESKNKKYGRSKRVPAKSWSVQPELIEPRKIFVNNLPRYVTKKHLLEKFEKVGTIEEITLPRTNGAHTYAFIKFSSDEDTERALKLTGKELKMKGVRIYIKAAKILIKMPGFPDYVRKPLDDRSYDLQPLLPDEPSAHALNDYVLLKIFDCLPFRDLVPYERVCRRWQHLVYSSFKRRVSKYINSDIMDWMILNKIGRNIEEFTKILIYGGESIAELSIKFGFLGVIHIENSKILRIIGQLCPNLKSITFGNNFMLQASHFVELGTLCPKLEEFIIYYQHISDVSSNVFSAIVSCMPELRVLRLSGTIVKINGLLTLPKHLKELQLHCCAYASLTNSLSKLMFHSDELNPLDFDVSGILQCPELEIIQLSNASLNISSLNKIGRYCTKLRVLSVTANRGGESEKIDWELFKNLEILSCHAVILDLEKIIKILSKLEELQLTCMFQVNENTVHDFSQLTNLKRFELSDDCPQHLNTVSLQTFYQCKHLEEFKYNKTIDNNRFLLSLIHNCPKLKVLECPHATIIESDIKDFVNANRGREFRLKFVVGLDHSALDQIEKLEEANYDIEMFDTDDLFNEFDLLYGGVVEEDDFDNYSEYSESSMLYEDSYLFAENFGFDHDEMVHFDDEIQRRFMFSLHNL